mmetsp:Transcript_9908/g.22210  ORF Transcript_9908/g.22210 Transcript_9908/m.22210 type:complete len:638 (-) Transcript_9908:45-1958(-)
MSGSGGAKRSEFSRVGMLLKSAKESALRGSKLSAHLLERMKAGAQALSPVAGSSSAVGSSAGRGTPVPASSSLASAGATATSVAVASAEAERALENEKVERLCALGFSAAAARHALHRSMGRVEEAGMWLLEEGNGDEILAAEMAAKEANPFQAGSSARIIGLLGAVELNGAVVVLQKYNEETQRWLVQTPDGLVKSIRPHNLEPWSASKVDLKVAGGQTESPEMGARGGGLAPRVDLKAACSGVPVEELRAHVREMLGGEDAEVEECLAALSIDELLEVVAGLSGSVGTPSSEKETPPPLKPVFMPEKEEITSTATCSSPSQSREPAPGPRQPPPLFSSQVATAGAAVSVASEEEGLKEQGCLASECVDVPAKVSPVPVPLLTEVAPSAVPAAEDLKHLERRLQEAAEAMAAREAAQRRRAQELEAREAGLRESEARWREEAAAKAQQLQDLATERAAEEASRVVNGRHREAEEQRAEIERLQAQTAEAAAELERHKTELAISRTAAEERELRLLEEEVEQHKITEQLREEQGRLGQQRRGVELLKQSLLENSAKQLSQLDPESICVEVQFDDEAARAAETTVGGGGGSAAAVPAEEVWDMDWSALDSKPSAAAPATATEAASAVAVAAAPIDLLS